MTAPEGLPREVRIWAQMQTMPDLAGDMIVGGMVESGALCNLRCPFCPTGNGELTLSREFLSLSGFKKILKALGPKLRWLVPYNWGEPLLNPDLDGMLAACRERGVLTEVSSNLSLPDFTRERAESLVRSGLDKLFVSCGGVTQATYELYRVGGDLNLVLSNLRELLAAKRRLASATPEIVWLFHVHKQNEGDVPEARRLAAQHGVEIHFRDLIYPKEAEAQWARDRAAAPAGAPAPDGDGENFVPGRLCLQIWSTAVVHSDGTVLPCCVVNSPEYALGNALREPLRDLWNKPLIVAMRRYLRAGIEPGMKIPCRGCVHDPRAPRA